MKINNYIFEETFIVYTKYMNNSNKLCHLVASNTCEETTV